MNNITAFLDKAAYNSPNAVPQDIQRNDKVLYRLYYRYMCLIYRSFKANGDTGELKKLKANFIKDFELCEALFKSALKSCREQNRLNAALIECRKNSDNCPCCKVVSEIIGAPTAANEPNIEVQ